MCVHLIRLVILEVSQIFIGGALMEQPVRRWPGVRYSHSAISSEWSGVSGLELSYCFNVGEQGVHLVSGQVMGGHVFPDQTPASQSPPKWGALGGE